LTRGTGAEKCMRKQPSSVGSGPHASLLCLEGERKWKETAGLLAHGSSSGRAFPSPAGDSGLGLYLLIARFFSGKPFSNGSCSQGKNRCAGKRSYRIRITRYTPKAAVLPSHSGGTAPDLHRTSLFAFRRSRKDRFLGSLRSLSLYRKEK
jgi:hypothetical protein